MTIYLSQREFLSKVSKISDRNREVIIEELLASIPGCDEADIVTKYIFGFFVGEHYEGTVICEQKRSSAQIRAPHFEHKDVAEAAKRLKDSGWNIAHYVIGNEIVVDGISADLGKRIMKSFYSYMPEKRKADVARFN